MRTLTNMGVPSDSVWVGKAKEKKLEESKLQTEFELGWDSYWIKKAIQGRKDRSIFDNIQRPPVGSRARSSFIRRSASALGLGQGRNLRARSLVENAWKGYHDASEGKPLDSTKIEDLAYLAGWAAVDGTHRMSAEQIKLIQDAGFMTPSTTS